MNKKIIISTISSFNFLPFVLNLYSSLILTKMDFKLYIFCMDKEIEDFLRQRRFNQIGIINFERLLDVNEKKKILKFSLPEICWALKPRALLYLNSRFRHNWKLYVDSDFFFFNDISEYLNFNSKKFSILFTPHRYSYSFLKYEKNAGKINAGFIAIKQSIYLPKILNEWFNLCLNRPIKKNRKGETFDQKILDFLHNKYDFIGLIRNTNINLAPWNIVKEKIKGEQYEDKKIICYHYQALKIYKFTNFFSIIDSYGGALDYNSDLKRLYNKINESLALNIKKLSEFELSISNFNLNLSLKEFLKMLMNILKKKKHIKFLVNFNLKSQP